MAAVDLFVLHAITFAAKHQAYAAQGGGHIVRLRGQLRQVRARGGGGRAKVTRRHGAGAQVVDALHGFFPRLHDAGLVQHVGRAAGAFLCFGAVQHVVPTGLHQHQVVKAHNLHGARYSAYVAGMAGVQQNESSMHVNQICAAACTTGHAAKHGGERKKGAAPAHGRGLCFKMRILAPYARLPIHPFSGHVCKPYPPVAYPLRLPAMCISGGRIRDWVCSRYF